MRFLFAAIVCLTVSSGSASSIDWENANDAELVKQVEAVKVETVKNVKARSLAASTPAPTRKFVPTSPPVPKPTAKPSVRGTLAPNVSRGDNICLFTSKKVYDCGEPIEATFNYAYYELRQYPRFTDRLAIYPCYVNTFRSAEVWQWGCGAPPATPASCVLPRSRGNVVFDKKPSYNGGDQMFPVAPNKRSNGKVNRCFKVVILRSDTAPYERYCESPGFTIKENSKKGCAIRASSPSGN